MLIDNYDSFTYNLVQYLGVLGAEYIIENKLAGYFPRHAIVDHLNSGALCPVPDAPKYSLPVWLIWREDLAQPIRLAAIEEIDAIAAKELPAAKNRGSA